MPSYTDVHCAAGVVAWQARASEDKLDQLVDTYRQQLTSKPAGIAKWTA